MKNLVEQSGQPLLLEYSEENREQQNQFPQFRPQPPVRTIGNQVTYNYDAQVLKSIF